MSRDYEAIGPPPAEHAHALTNPAASDDAREQRALLISWWDERVEPMVSELLSRADGMGRAGHPTAALEIAEEVVFLRSTVRRLATESDLAGIADAAAALSERLHRLRWAIEEGGTRR